VALVHHFYSEPYTAGSSLSRSVSLNPRRYADGSCRPRCRGWLHVPMTLAGLVWIGMTLLRHGPLERVLFVLLKSLSFAASVNLHVVPHMSLRSHTLALCIDCFLVAFNCGSYCILLQLGEYDAWAVDLLVMLLCGLGNAYAHWRILRMDTGKDEEDPVINERMSSLLQVSLFGITVWTARCYLIHAGVTWGLVVTLILYVLGMASVAVAAWKKKKRGFSKDLPWHTVSWGGHEDAHVIAALMDCILFCSIPVKR